MSMCQLLIYIGLMKRWTGSCKLCNSKVKDSGNCSKLKTCEIGIFKAEPKFGRGYKSISAEST